MVIDALINTNAALGTTTLIITHNATIQDVAHRVLSFADGRIARERVNPTRRAAAELAW
jgi:putative ABC transport system ATP-binding protein